MAAFERTVEPDQKASAAYRELFEKWLKIYRGSMELAESGLVRPLVACGRHLTDSDIGGNMPEADARTDKNFF